MEDSEEKALEPSRSSPQSRRIDEGLAEQNDRSSSDILNLHGAVDNSEKIEQSNQDNPESLSNDSEIDENMDELYDENIAFLLSEIESLQAHLARLGGSAEDQANAQPQADPEFINVFSAFREEIGKVRENNLNSVRQINDLTTQFSALKSEEGVLTSKLKQIDDDLIAVLGTKPQEDAIKEAEDERISEFDYTNILEELQRKIKAAEEQVDFKYTEFKKEQTDFAELEGMYRMKRLETDASDESKSETDKSPLSGNGSKAKAGKNR
eukprot:CAMPEP_0168327158 /NCGR_PEP_ID=MMETSP0213-20121227/5739_1 /TAXON_ID=151035 /ORGANISM="Euplotes harpa, Strain FSP1.4" /LENGTH=266 /DNA_ID=CAMNT_0008330025 /DNA_START=1 /DNA_END=801 /DNA_ORIENTATION=+